MSASNDSALLRYNMWDESGNAINNDDYEIWLNYEMPILKNNQMIRLGIADGNVSRI